MIRTILLLVAAVAVSCSPVPEEPVPEPPGTYVCPVGDNCVSSGCLYQNEKNCSQFWQCDLSGRVFRKHCPQGLQFNQRIRVCDWPPSPTCGREPEPEPEPEVVTTPEPTTTQEPTTEEPTTPGRPVPPEEFTCPGDGCLQTGCLYQKPSNCSQFYQCDLAGNVWVKDCPAGLEFNENARVCDWPPSPTCRRSPPPPEPTPEPTTTSTTTTTPEPTTTEEPTTPGRPVPPEEFTCPGDGCVETGCVYQKPSNCSQFYQCDLAGNVWVKDCPAGLEFNENARVCDWPPSPTCRRSPPPPEPTPEPTTTTTEATEAPTTTQEPTTPEAPVEGEFVCPPPVDLCLQTGCLYQNQQDCTKFWQCDLSGRAFRKQCPSGLEFNEKVRVCDYPPSPTCALNKGPQL